MYGKPAADVHADLACHDIIMRLSRDKLRKAAIDGLQSEPLRHQGCSGLPNIGHIRATHTAHEMILDAIITGDGPAARMAMREHTEGSAARRPVARTSAD